MLSFLLLLLLVIIIVVVILVLRKNQQKHAKETADRTAPLPALGDTLPDFAPVRDASDSVNDSTVVTTTDNWQLQVKMLRTGQQYDEALEVCRAQFPKIQAMQQAAIVLRQQLKISQENNVDYDHLLQNLYNLAALADVYSDTRRKPPSLERVMAALYNSKQHYRSMGYQKLSLLNKSDIRLLEQAWGRAGTHRRAEEIYKF